MDYEPNPEEAAPPTSSTSGIPTRPASSYRASEDFQILLKLIKHRAPVEVDIDEPTE